jgi:pimeloyl-ACP methyl ester carboxylesterase
MAGEIPDARQPTVSGAPHLANLERPAAFNRAVLGFLSRSVPDRDANPRQRLR